MRKFLLFSSIFLLIIASLLMVFAPKDEGPPFLRPQKVMAQEDHDTFLDDFYSGSVWEGLDNEFIAAAAPWDWEMASYYYDVRVVEDFTAGQIIELEVDGSTIQFQPMALEWSNDLGQIQAIEMPVDVTPTLTNPIVATAGETKHQGTITWGNAYGSGIDFEWKCTPKVLEKLLVISGLTDLPMPAQYILDGGNPFLRLNLIFDHSSDMDVYVDNSLWGEQNEVQTFDAIEFRREGEVLWWFSPLKYWDSIGEEGYSVATLERSGNKLYISVRVPYSWLQSAIFPVFIDADVAVETSTAEYLHYQTCRNGPFWVSTTTGYLIYNNDGNDLVYRKTTNGGSSWGSEEGIVEWIRVMMFDCWADWQTVGDSGTVIHIAYLECESDDVMYAYLDTDGDSVGSDFITDASTGITLAAMGFSNHCISITKARGGNIDVVYKYRDDSNSYHYGFYTSPDADTWTSETSPFEGSSVDIVEIYAGNEADNQDIWASYYDGSTAQISLKTYDDSGDSWSEQSIDNSVDDLEHYHNFEGQIRLSDGHLILVYFDDLWSSNPDCHVYDINGAGSISQKADITTAETEFTDPSVLIDQINDDIYVSYVAGDDYGTSTACMYAVSVNGGTSWSTDQAMQEDTPVDHAMAFAGCIDATNGGRFLPVWWERDDRDLFCNTNNAVTLEAGGCSPSIELDQSSWSVNGGSVVDEDTAYNTGLDWCTITNNSGGSVDIYIQGTDMTGGTAWDLSDDYSNGADIYGMRAGLYGGSYNIDVKESTTNLLKDSLADSGTQDFGLQMLTPTSYSDGVSKSGTVTVTAVCE